MVLSLLFLEGRIRKGQKLNRIRPSSTTQGKPLLGLLQCCCCCSCCKDQVATHFLVLSIKQFVKERGGIFFFYPQLHSKVFFKLQTKESLPTPDITSHESQITMSQVEVFSFGKDTTLHYIFQIVRAKNLPTDIVIWMINLPTWEITYHVGKMVIYIGP